MLSGGAWKWRLIAALSCAGALTSARGYGVGERQGARLLRFAWPDGPLGKMKYSSSKGTNGARSQTLSVVWDMAARRGADGSRLIVWSQPNVLESPSGATAGGQQQLLDRMQPPISVNALGQFMAIPLGASDALLRSVTDPGGNTPIPPSAREMLVSILDARSRNFWTRLVGQWSSRRLLLGTTYPVNGKATVLPGMPLVALTGSGQVSRMIPCPGGPVQPSCIEISESSSVSPADFGTVLNAMGTKMGGDMTAIARQMQVKEVTVRSRVLTDPDTLLPRLMRSERLVSISFGGGEPQNELDVEEWTFSYSPGAGSKSLQKPQR